MSKKEKTNEATEKEKVDEKYKKKKKKTEKNYSIKQVLFIVIPSITILIFNLMNKEQSNWIVLNKNNIYTLIITISATMLGFIITSMSIIIVFLNKKELYIIKKRSSKDIYYRYIESINTLALLTIFSLFH